MKTILSLVFLLFTIILNLKPAYGDSQVYFYCSHGITILNFQDSEATSIKEIIQLINTCPPWNGMTITNVELNMKIIETLNRISNYNLTIIRKAIKIYSDESKKNDLTYSERMSPIFLLNRYLFNVPSELRSYKRYYWGVTGVPVKEGKVNWLWPFIQEKNGDIILKGFPIAFRGSEYFAIEEFDFFNKTFGPRKQLKRAVGIEKKSKNNRNKIQRN